MRLVRFVYNKLFVHGGKFTSSISEQDMIQIGMVGLCKAVITFNESFGSKFSTYAVQVISNEMLMEVRKQFPQGYRRTNKTRKYITPPHTLSLEHGYRNNMGQYTVIDIEDHASIDFVQEIERQQSIRYSIEALSLLGTQEREIIVLCILQNLTQKEAGCILGISQSYASRLLKASLQKLRTMAG